MSAHPSPTVEASPRERVLATADRLFDARGFAPVSLSRVARDVGISVSELRSSFPEKQDLVLAVLRERHRVWFGDLTTATALQEDPRDGVLAVFTFLEECFAQLAYSGCMFINGYGELGRRSEDVARLADEHLGDVERLVAELCAAAELPLHLAQAIALLVDGAKVQSAIHRTVEPARTARTAAAMLMAVYESDLPR